MDCIIQNNVLSPERASWCVYLNYRRRPRARGHLKVGYRPQAFWSRSFSVHFLSRSISLEVCAIGSAPRSKSAELTMPAAATPRSKPSNSEHALHNSLLDMYPHRLHVSTKSSMSSSSENGGSLDATHVVLSVSLSLPPLQQTLPRSE